MYALSVPADNVAVMNAPQKGNLLQIDWHIRVSSAGADFFHLWELSRAPTAGAAINGLDILYSVIRHAQEFTTSGVVAETLNWTQYFPKPVPFSLGQRVYLNGAGTAVQATINVLLMFDFM
jgi:hypothetical protein